LLGYTNKALGSQLSGMTTSAELHVAASVEASQMLQLREMGTPL